MIPPSDKKDGTKRDYSSLMEQFEKEVTVYPVSCEKLSAGRSDRQWLESVLAGGARIVQLRDKESPDPQLLAKARFFREKTREAGAIFMMNDRLDIALLAEADGLHVGQGDLPPEEIRKLAPELILGLSCNSVKDVKLLHKKIMQDRKVVSYFNVGPIYETGTKEGLKQFLGPQAIASFTAHCSIPFTVMGGIKYNHIEELVHSGARRIAVVTAITLAEDMTSETSRWVSAIGAAVAGREVPGE